MFWYQGCFNGMGAGAIGNCSLFWRILDAETCGIDQEKAEMPGAFCPFVQISAQEFFDLPAALPFMQFTVRVKASAKGIYPGADACRFWTPRACKLSR